MEEIKVKGDIEDEKIDNLVRDLLGSHEVGLSLSDAFGI